MRVDVSGKRVYTIINIQGPSCWITETLGNESNHNDLLVSSIVTNVVQSVTEMNDVCRHNKDVLRTSMYTP